MSEERQVGWYKCVDMPNYLMHYSDNKLITETYFIGDKCEVFKIVGGEGFAKGVESGCEDPLISYVEWGMFEPCDPPTIGEGEKPNYDTPVEPEVDYKALFEELLEVTENSDGVAGLHRNDDIATWDELENNNWLPLLKEWKEKQHA